MNWLDSQRMIQTKNEEERLEIEKRFLILRGKINTGILKIRKNFGRQAGIAVILGEKEIRTLYDTLDVVSPLVAGDLVTNEYGIITNFWGNKLYYSGEKTGVSFAVDAEGVSNDLLFGRV